MFSPGGGEREHQPIEAIPGVEAICVQLQRTDQCYRGLLADIEEHSVSEIKAAGLLRRTAEALAHVAVVDGEGEGDWGVSQLRRHVNMRESACALAKLCR